MKKNIILLSFMMISSSIFSQIGINTTAPAATLDVRAKNTTGTTTNAEGLLVPRIDRLRAQSMGTAASPIPVSTLIYVTSISNGTQAGNAINIDAPGYYYFENNVWTKLKNPAGGSAADSNIYNNNGTLQSNRTVAQSDKTLAFSGTAANAFSVDGTTLSVDAANNRVGLGTATPATPLEINNGTIAGAIKIVDGTQGNNKVLMSDTNGVGTWKSIPGSLWMGILNNGSASSQPQKVDFTGAQVLGQGGSANSTTNSITVPTAGLYEIIINGAANSSSTSNTKLITWSIRRNGTPILSPHYAFPGNFTQYLSFTNYTTLNEGDVITLFLSNPFSAGDPVSSADSVVFSVKLLQ